MPSYNVQWLVENQVISIDLKGSIDMDVAISLSDKLTALIDTSTKATVHVIVNDHQAVTVPKVSEINRLQSSLKHPKVGWIVSVGENMNPIVKFVSSVAIQLAGVKFKRVNSLEEATALLKQIDPTIEWTSRS